MKLRTQRSQRILVPDCEFFWSESLYEAWKPPQFQEKRSRSERAIPGALGEFRDI